MKNAAMSSKQSQIKRDASKQSRWNNASNRVARVHEWRRTEEHWIGTIREKCHMHKVVFFLFLPDGRVNVLPASNAWCTYPLLPLLMTVYTPEVMLYRLTNHTPNIVHCRFPIHASTTYSLGSNANRRQQQPTQKLDKLKWADFCVCCFHKFSCRLLFVKRWCDCCVWTSEAMQRWNYYHEPLVFNSHC